MKNFSVFDSVVVIQNFIPQMIDLFQNPIYENIYKFGMNLSYDERKKSFELSKPNIQKIIEQISKLNDICDFENILINADIVTAYHILNTAFGKIDILKSAIETNKKNYNIHIPKDFRNVVLFFIDYSKGYIFYDNEKIILMDIY